MRWTPSLRKYLSNPKQGLWSIYQVGIIIGYSLWPHCVVRLVFCKDDVGVQTGFAKPLGLWRRIISCGKGRPVIWGSSLILGVRFSIAASGDFLKLLSRFTCQCTEHIMVLTRPASAPFFSMILDVAGCTCRGLQKLQGFVIIICIFRWLYLQRITKTTRFCRMHL